VDCTDPCEKELHNIEPATGLFDFEIFALFFTFCVLAYIYLHADIYRTYIRLHSNMDLASMGYLL